MASKRVSHSRPLARTLLTVAIGLALITVLAGCTAPPKAPAAKTGTIDVGMMNFAFIPKEETIKVGSIVRWTNQDAMTHDVTGADRAWQSDGGDGGIAAGATFEKTFAEAGVFEYYCTLHSGGPGQGMSGKITVVA